MSKRVALVFGLIFGLAALNFYFLWQARERALERAVPEGGPRAAQPLLVAAASDLNPALAEIAAAFERETGVRAEVTFGSSGSLYAQIENGAPFDVFLSASVDYARDLIQKDRAEADPLIYARGKLVLWARERKLLSPDEPLERALSAPAAWRIAIANPQHAPYGQAAVAALRHYGLYDRQKKKLVLGENVGQAAQFVHSGNAEVGLIALSQALAPAMQAGAFREVPHEAYPPIQQAGVLVKERKNPMAAKFLAFLGSPEAQRILQRYGFETPEGP